MNESYAYGMWFAVVVYAGIFIFFGLGFLRPQKRFEWRSASAFSAFVIAFFTEMYGIPLTVYILTSILGSQYPVIDPFTHINGHLWVALAGGSTLVWKLVMAVSNLAILGGLVIMGVAWAQIHTAKGKLVTSGLYSLVRHPQYCGLSVLMVGMLIQWPTIVTMVMWPILMYTYYRLACREETEMETAFGEGYEEYKREVPMLLPRLGAARNRLTV